jgi:hypothetical protein
MIFSHEVNYLCGDPLGYVSQNLGNYVSSIVKWPHLPVGSCKMLFLQMKPNLVAHLKLVGNPMLIMTLLILGIGFLQNIMDMLADFLNPFNESSCLVRLRLSMGRFCMCGCKG